MSFDDFSTKHGTDRVSSAKVLILVILSAVIICFIAVLIWFNSINKRKTMSFEALTSGASSNNVDIASVVSVSEDDLAISPEEKMPALKPDFVEDMAIEIQLPNVSNQESDVSEVKYRSVDYVKFSEYVVKEGDSVAKIAKENNLRNQTIIQINGLRTVYPEVGTVLTIPSIDGQIYTVHKGDTFFSLAQRFSVSLSWNTFKAINNIESDVLEEGMRLFIPHASVESIADSNIDTALNIQDSFLFPLKSGNVAVDFSNNTQDPISGTPVELDGVLIQTFSAADVVCSFAGQVVDRGFNTNGTSFIKILHDNGYTSYYDYLTWANVEIGQKLLRGERIGAISEGNTKLVTPTLFFRIEQDGIALNPSYFF